MIHFHQNMFLLLLSIVFLSASVTSSKPRKMQRLTTGRWGGVHIVINVEEQSASISYDCASGTIAGPLTIEKSGRFTWRGTFRTQRPGPTRRDEAANDSPVIYSGTIVGDEMTLQVKRVSNNEVLGDFSLKRGSPGRVFRCK
jgi:hypothetical protein